jgi:putative addiction module component (TIGR02574 family)
MSLIFGDIETQARSLPPEERARLVESLLESLQEQNQPTEMAWEREIQERVASYRMGEELIDAETVFAEMREIAR